ncbi:KilA-N domain-containing protein [Pectobacterium brasiliense]|uniref:KilA-N domain-containing protein n=1 Tax=Pectobacterium brasiliense TaxID=180957 RepID=UPI0025A210B1|nr:KilA-N domain-containing protein [Pectobacterium brasiliense]WJM80440.1 KilA-N domain-containing protein [Pectobacterium brasiliense]
MQHPTVAVNGVSVRVDEEGRYSLNDLHIAAVSNGQATESQGPSQFLRSKKVRAFVETLSRMQKCTLEQNQPLKVINGGVSQGVWAHELIAIRYAAWINPEFEIRVYSTFRDAILDGLSAMNRLNRLDLLIANETKEVSACARRMNQWGVGGRKKILHITRERMASEIQLLVPGIEA